MTAGSPTSITAAALDLEQVMEKFQRHSNQFADKDSDDQYTTHSSPQESSFQEDSPKPDSEDGRERLSPSAALSAGGKSDNDSDGGRDDEISAIKASQSALIAQQLQLAAAFAQQRVSSGGNDSNLSSFMPQAMMSQFHQFHNGFDQSQIQHVSIQLLIYLILIS